MKDIKYSYPLEFSKYYISDTIQHMPTFAW